MSNERFTITIESLPDDTPSVVRLRRVLKGLLRHWRFKCTAVLPADVVTVDDDTGAVRKAPT